MMKERIVLTGPLAARVVERLASRFELVRADSAADAVQLLGAAPSRDVRAVASGSSHGRIDGRLFDVLPGLQIVAHYGVGYDTVDAVEAARRGIVVTHTPGVLDDDVADLALGLVIASVRQFPRAERHVRSGAWAAAKFPLGPTLRNRTVGILGLGRIGKAIARRCAGIGLRVVYHGRREQPGVELPFYPSLVEMARAADVLIVCAPGGASTRHMVNREVLAALGPDGVLVNVARGTLVDEQALVDALTNRSIFAAGLDVYENEPKVSEALLALENVVLLPHIGSASFQTREAMSDLLVDNICSWYDGAGALTPVPESAAMLEQGKGSGLRASSAGDTRPPSAIDRGRSSIR